MLLGRLHVIVLFLNGDPDSAKPLVFCRKKEVPSGGAHMLRWLCRVRYAGPDPLAQPRQRISQDLQK